MASIPTFRETVPVRVKGMEWWSMAVSSTSAGWFTGVFFPLVDVGWAGSSVGGGHEFGVEVVVGDEVVDV